MRWSILSFREVSMSYERRLGAAQMIFTTLAPGVVCFGIVVPVNKLRVVYVLYYIRNAHRPTPKIP